MTIVPAADLSFRRYGQLLDGYDTGALVTALRAHTPLPKGVEYEASCAELERAAVVDALAQQVFGGMAVQAGWCGGHSRGLSCVEFHKSSEVLVGASALVLLLARLEDMADHVMDTSAVRAFSVPAGAAVELYAGTLHYSPCGAGADGAFQAAVILPRGTNLPLEKDPGRRNHEEKMLWQRNKWLLASAGTPEATTGAVVAVCGPDVTL